MARKTQNDDPLDAALTQLGALTPLGSEDRDDIQNAILGIVRIRSRRAAPKPRKVRRNGRLVPVEDVRPTIPTVTPLPRENPFYGLGLKEACPRQLSLVPKKHVMSAKEIWEALSAAGFVTAHSEPVSAVHTALRRRAKTHADVLLVGNGKWGRKDWYTEDELEEIQKSVGGMGGRDAVEHSQRTRTGMIVARRRGVRLGAPLFMTPERIQEAKERLAAGDSVRKIVRDWGKTPQMLYRYVPKEEIKRIRQESASAEKQAIADESQPSPRIVN